MQKKLNKVSAARKTYEIYWESYHNGDLETFASTLDDRFEMIGTSESEVCHSKTDGIAFFKVQMKEVVGKAEMRNRQIEVIPIDQLMLVNEQCDIYVLVDPDLPAGKPYLSAGRKGWNFYSKIRISTFLRETESGWKVFQQHGSLPDMRLQKGETMALEKISKENLELRDAVKRRTAELENKNRELAIEAALEKVRAVAMGMKTPEDMLDVCRAISDQLQQFGVEKIRNVQTAIIDENIGQYLCYQYFTPYDQTTIEKTEYLKSPVENGMVKQMLASRDGYFIGRLSDKELEDFRIHRKEENHFPDPLLDKATELDYCFLSIGEGGLGLTLYQPITEDILTLFKRFHQVFSLAYQRFRDIQKAEAQAREAQIEVAVERVRAQSMAMLHPNDLDKVNKEILTQLNLLQIQGLSGVTFYLDDQDGWVKAWDFSSPGNIGNQKSYTLQFDFKKYEMLGYPFKIFQQTDLNYLVADYPLEKLERAVIELEEINPVVANAFKEALAKGVLTHQWSACARITDGILGVDLVRPPSEDTKTIVLKIAGAFNQAYQRFLDLQKAEAHARESEIDLALERVRAQTMAMHSSEDVGKCVVKMFSELTALGVDEGTRFGIGILNHDNENNQLWTARKTGEEVNMHIGNINMAWHPMLKRARQAWLEQVPFHKYVLEGEDLLDYYQMLNNAPDYKIQIPFEQLPKKEIQHCFIFEHGFFYAFSPREFQPELIHITKRFSALFEQTYRRYLDLVRAEAQAREAEIELALERVRARTMAMQESDELAEVSSLLFQQMEALGVSTYSSGFTIWDEDQDELISWMCNADGSMNPPFRMPIEEDKWHKEQYDSWEKGDDFIVKNLNGEEMQSYFRYLRSFPLLDEAFEKSIAAGHPMPDRQVHHVANFSHGNLLFITLEPYPKAHELFKRFSKVFEQTYTRFLDLQKAEAQAREAEIQLALERVRAKTMAMKTQSDLLGIIELFGEQLNAVGIRFHNVTFIEGPITKKRDWDLWSYAPEAENTTDKILIPYIETPYFTKTAKAVKEHQKTGQPIHVKTFTKKEKNEFLDHYWKHAPAVSDEFVNYVNATPGSIIVDAFLEEITVSMVKWNTEPYTVEELEIFERFAKEFRQTYIRFLDIKKAEAQVREAKIETSLEKVRSRTMGMQNSDELAEVANVLFAEMNDLVHNLWTCGFVLCEKGREEDEWWLSLEDGFSRGFYLPNVNDYAHATLYEGWLEGDSFRTVQLDGDKLQEHYDWLMEIPVAKNIFDEMEAAGMQRPEWQKLHAAYFSKGYLVIITREPCPEEEIFKRFAKVFDQTYTRFLDLQKAEAQARESKIETALEKVRSRTMGMQSSEELPEVANLLFTEVRSLGIPAWSCGYNILEEDKKTATAWMSSEGIMQTPFQLRLFGEASFDEMGEFIPSDHIMFVQELGGKALEDHYTYMKTFPDLQSTFKNIEEQGLSLPTYQINHLCKFGHGFLLFITYEQVPDAHGIFKRFTSVFDQTYTRFLDLKKAEAQTREAQIENALEKVRSRSLAMQDPEELTEVAQLLREEMGALGVEELETSSIYIHDESSGLTQCWFTIKNPDNPDRAITDQMVIDLQDTWVGRKMDEFYQSKAKQTSILMQGEGRIEWIRYCEEKSDLFGTSNFYGETIPDRTYHLYKFSNGYIGAAAPGEISSESWELLKRATGVFSFAYTRFRDLQLAEASARTAMRQASLDRVRADISSMRNADDLDRITPLFFHELTTLGIPFIRCGVFIVHEKERNVEIYLSTSEGKSLAAMNLPFEANEMTARSVEAWKKEQVYIQHWNKADFINWSKSLQEQGHVKDLKTYQGADAAPESLHLHFVPFAQGLLYVGSPRTLAEEQIDLVKALARSFAIAYARYEDFVKLEQAKAEVESAMSELKATQSQLVQQEKLASLGQLTAGIAHEIKNPLNFVNNFSEVSIEMIEEVLEARSEKQDEKRDESEEMEDEILEDIKANLKKIHEHGSRANGIVTSMLQHSRGGSGKMEPTELNTLIKEYVNLSYHGMRAGKNSIDVEIALDLDPEIKEVSLIKEDFTRVIINLCNNAFDAMRGEVDLPGFNPARAGLAGLEAYHPKLTVRTKTDNNHILIEVADNGPGIPRDIKDKILQPFFTTKKGTEGTGLGLSITNDIIKAHGGVLEIESSTDVGSNFIIKLSRSP